MIAVDTDVLSIYHVFTWDKRHTLCKRFLRSLKEGAVSIHNLLELCSIIARASNASTAMAVYRYYLSSPRWHVLFPNMPSGWPEYLKVILDKYIVERGFSYGDALVAWALEEFPELEAFVTWDVKDFRGKLQLPVYTPEEWLRKMKS